MEFSPLTGDRVPRWITHHVETVLGATITPDAAELLQQATGNELAALAAELDKLASYAGGGTIDEAAVADVVGVRRGETLGDFLDQGGRARCRRRARAPAAHSLAAEDERGLDRDGADDADARHRMGNHAQRPRRLLRAAQEREGRSRCARGARPRARGATAERHWNDDAIDAALDALLAADIALKETRLSTDAQLLSESRARALRREHSTDAARLLLSAIPA